MITYFHGYATRRFCWFVLQVMERAVKDYCDKPDRLELHNPSAWFTHHAHELCFRSDPEDLEAGARDWLNDEKIKAGGRSRDKERAAKKARGERVNGGGGGSGGGGGRGSGWVSRGGGSRIMGRGRGGGVGMGLGGGGDADRGGGGGGGRGGAEPRGAASFPAAGTRGVSSAAAATGDAGGGDGSSASASARGVNEEWAKIWAPGGDPVEGQQGGGTPGERAGGDGGAAGGESERVPQQQQQRDTSDLMSIFPSLRGRGGGRGGTMGGRGGGGGGRGFRQGGIRAS